MKPKNILLAILILLFALPASAQNFLYFKKKSTAAGGGATCSGSTPTCLFRETFDNTTDYDNTPVVTGGTLYPNYTTSPAPLQGTESLRMDAAFGTVAWTISSSSELWATAILRVGPSNPPNNRELLSLQNGTTILAAIYLNTSMVVSATNNGGTSQNGPTLSYNTTYYLKLYAKKGSGSNAIAEMKIYSDAAFTSQVGTTATSSDGTWTSNMDRVYIRGTTLDAGVWWLWDDVRVDTANIANY